MFNLFYECIMYWLIYFQVSTNIIIIIIIKVTNYLNILVCKMYMYILNKRLLKSIKTIFEILIGTLN